ncbi:peptidoglycan-binding protein LysM [Alysiella filiformis]|uniref:Potassium binding protein Kbp n=1 Tax=Alysiella filiformis DSM 16848 TaxID=1120981 RepID=A0A286EFS2_9NEIS|nr:peptidoglycan-binding protein LysM [Alysiella filiformis]QMT30653.1 peptidoglycan-binding protein LysM [Alysiella filiformis]UBQ56369.1 peptidoglycan-binding protein LysM [Alysiella filiformis DSM 16848]SOD69664.1 LysM domain-containing protein [Alysiella filiformis DSM 16848]
MGLFSFIKDAGEKLFGSDDPLEIQNKIQEYVAKQNLGINMFTAIYDTASETVTLRGYAPNQEAIEKAVLAAGNVHGVSKVDNHMKLQEEVAAAAAQEAATVYHDVVAGDTLSAIAKKYYGDANQYPKIFEANKPMLSHPDKIYVGQKLRIPQ